MSATEKSDKFQDRLKTFRTEADLSAEELAKKLGVSRDYIYQLESGDRAPGRSLELLFSLMEASPLYGTIHRTGSSPAKPAVDSRVTGVLAQCDDPKAFAIGVAFDSMSPALEPGDVVILMPSHKPRHGEIVGVQHPSQGQFIRIYNVEPGNLVRLSAINPAWRDLVDSADAFDWIYPAHSFVRLLQQKPSKVAQ